GVDRILRLLDRLKLRATFFIPGWTVVNHLPQSKRVRDAGHEIGAHGNVHEAVAMLDQAQEKSVLQPQLASLKDQLGAVPAVHRDARRERLLRADVSPVHQRSGLAGGAHRGPRAVHAQAPRRVVHDLRGGRPVAREGKALVTRPPTFDFADQAVLVTGAGAGIGFGIAQAFFDAGARVALGDVRAEPLKRAADRLGGGKRVFAQTMDV